MIAAGQKTFTTEGTEEKQYEFPVSSFEFQACRCELVSSLRLET
jgi:hypothetical protein